MEVSSVIGGLRGQQPAALQAQAQGGSGTGTGTNWGGARGRARNSPNNHADQGNYYGG